MFTGWISLEVRIKKRSPTGYKEVTSLQVVGERTDFGSVALRTTEHGRRTILPPGRKCGLPRQAANAFSRR
jgi:hypothetical protein